MPRKRVARRKRAGGTKVGGGVKRKRRKPRVARRRKAGFLGEVAKHILLGYALNKLGIMGGHGGGGPVSFP